MRRAATCRGALHKCEAWWGMRTCCICAYVCPVHCGRLLLSPPVCTWSGTCHSTNHWLHAAPAPCRFEDVAALVHFLAATYTDVVAEVTTSPEDVVEPQPPHVDAFSADVVRGVASC